MYKSADRYSCTLLVPSNFVQSKISGTTKVQLVLSGTTKVQEYPVSPLLVEGEIVSFMQ